MQNVFNAPPVPDVQRLKRRSKNALMLELEAIVQYGCVNGAQIDLVPDIHRANVRTMRIRIADVVDDGKLSLIEQPLDWSVKH